VDLLRNFMPCLIAEAMRNMEILRVIGVANAGEQLLCKACLSSESVNLLSIFEPAKQNLERILSLPMDAVCVYAPTANEETWDFINDIYMSRGRIGIFLISDDPDAQLLSRALATGVTEVIDANLDANAICAQICGGVERLRSRREHVHIAERDSKLICFYGTKGGCGKTSLAVNLATCLQKMDKLCAIVDLDLQFGDVADLLDIPQFESIADLASEKVINAENITPYLYRSAVGVEVLRAPQSPELAELVQPQLIERIVASLRCEYDYIIFDLSPALDDCSLEAMELSDTIYFVVNPEVPAIRNARTCLEVMAGLNLRDKIKLVVNKASRAFVSVKDVENTLHMEAEASISFDVKNSCMAVNRGVPVVKCAKRSKMSSDIYKFAKKVAQS
jgi:pilus assembly protein CpaE